MSKKFFLLKSGFSKKITNSIIIQQDYIIHDSGYAYVSILPVQTLNMDKKKHLSKFHKLDEDGFLIHGTFFQLCL